MNYKAQSLLIGTGLLFTSVALAQGNHSRTEQCATVHGRYSVYADGDRLWVVGSKHLLEIVIDDLDTQLEERGWESTVVYGDFVVCSANMKDPKQLTIAAVKAQFVVFGGIRSGHTHGLCSLVSAFAFARPR